MSARSSLRFVLVLTVTACSSSPAPSAPSDASPSDTTDARITDAPTADAPRSDGGVSGDVAGDATTGEPFPETTSVPVYQIVPGAGVVGGVAACVITGNTGGAFKLVCNGSGEASRFRRVRGSVWTTGTFFGFIYGCRDNKCALEAGDEVTMPVAVQGGQRVDFDWDVATELDGFEFAVTAEPVYFSIYMDGRAEPSRVLFPSLGMGGATVTASADGNPFGLAAQ